MAHFVSLGVFALFASLPFLWMLITAFKQDADLYDRTHNPFIFNMAPTLVHLKELFHGTLFLHWLLNTAWVGMLVVQEYIYTLTFVTTASRYTVSVGVPTFLVHGDVYTWGALMAGCLIASLPVVIVYNFFVEKFISGLTLSAVKG